MHTCKSDDSFESTCVGVSPFQSEAQGAFKERVFGSRRLRIDESDVDSLFVAVRTTKVISQVYPTYAGVVMYTPCLEETAWRVIESVKLLFESSMCMWQNMSLSRIASRECRKWQFQDTCSDNQPSK